MRTYRQASPNLFGPRTDSEGWAHLADGLRGPVQTQRDSIRMLDTNELERLSLRTRKAVARLVVGELVLVIWVFEEPLPLLRHYHLLISTGAFFQVTRGEVSGIGQRHLRLRPRSLLGLLQHRNQQGIVIGRIHHVHGGDQHAGRSPIRLCG